MMGTSLLSMPWALEQAGLVMGLLMMVGLSSTEIDIIQYFPSRLCARCSYRECVFTLPTESSKSTQYTVSHIPYQEKYTTNIRFVVSKLLFSRKL